MECYPLFWFAQPNISASGITMQNLADEENSQTRINLEGMSFLTFVEKWDREDHSSVTLLMTEKDDQGRP